VSVADPVCNSQDLVGRLRKAKWRPWDHRSTGFRSDVLGETKKEKFLRRHSAVRRVSRGTVELPILEEDREDKDVEVIGVVSKLRTCGVQTAFGGLLGKPGKESSPERPGGSVRGRRRGCGAAAAGRIEGVRLGNKI